MLQGGKGTPAQSRTVGQSSGRYPSGTSWLHMETPLPARAVRLLLLLRSPLVPGCPRAV
jgi:hypothetical protein